MITTINEHKRDDEFSTMSIGECGADKTASPRSRRSSRDLGDFTKRHKIPIRPQTPDDTPQLQWWHVVEIHFFIFTIFLQHLFPPFSSSVTLSFFILTWKLMSEFACYWCWKSMCIQEEKGSALMGEFVASRSTEAEAEVLLWMALQLPKSSAINERCLFTVCGDFRTSPSVQSSISITTEGDIRENDVDRS